MTEWLSSPGLFATWTPFWRTRPILVSIGAGPDRTRPHLALAIHDRPRSPRGGRMVHRGGRNRGRSARSRAAGRGRGPRDPAGGDVAGARHSTGRMGYPRDEELAREIAGTVIRDVQRAAESGIREASIRSGRRRGTAGPPNAGMSWAPTTWAMHTPPGGASPRIMSSRPQPGTRRRGKRWSASGAGRCFSSVAPPGPAPVQGRADLLRRAHLHSLDSGGIAVGATAPRSSGGESVLQRNRPRPGTKPNRGRDWRGSRKPATRSSPPACSRSRR